MSSRRRPRISRLLPVVGLAAALAATTMLATATAEKGSGPKVHVVTAADKEMAAKLAPEAKPVDAEQSQELAAGGPDGFGYVWSDSNEPDGPVYSWVDITASGTPLGLTDDGETDVPIGFAFPFYGGVFTDTATVLVSAPEPLVCNGDLVEFSAGPPLDWTVADNDGSGVVWTTTGIGGYPGNCGEGNYTDGTGNAACASSDQFGAAPYDTELWSPPFDTTGQLIVQLSYNANFQNFGGNDFLDVDVSIDGGSSWTNVLSWNEDHGGFRAPPGEAVNLDISAVAGNQPSVIVRWRWYDPNTGDDFNWYAQIDDASVFCDIPVELQTIDIE